MIPLRPELIEFMSAESLGRFTRCSKTLSTHLREMNAWRLLAGVQCPPRTTSDALEQDAISRVRSQSLRRRLAADLSRSEPSAARSDRLDQIRNRFTDFTYFVRIEDEDDGLIWEGDLGATPSCCVSHPTSGDECLELFPSRLMHARMNSWEDMVNYLRHVPTEDDYDENFIAGLKISIVAVREADSAMIALGSFTFSESIGDFGDDRQPYFFTARSRLCHLRSSNFRAFHYEPNLMLELMHDADGEGYVSRIRVYMGLHDSTADHLDDVNRSEFQLLLTHLAGVHHRDRQAVLSSLVATLDIGYAGVF